ncbi:ATP-dependent helicase HrpB [Desulfospira joergensenii]|uniref:ATP-dependent helicase HrpB n=1 Tax=Desulfospira joergensenii TaxID=53329 RepID=UPI0003B3C620|nr:ATP-dependent helicase HrpB [Desulfospira joergensenii]
MTHLPVEEVIPELKQALASQGKAVLQASPGAGKTTRVPLALMDEPWLGKKKILMLEPRRLAARTCAHYMAGLLGEPVGKTVGYQIRMERKISSHTRIFIITEGILTRMIQDDPSLENTGLVIFDEFHERHIHSDLGLALCLDAAHAFREDLKLLVMSATMDVDAVSVLLDRAPVIRSRGRAFPVSCVHLPPEQGAGQQARFRGRFSPVLAACRIAVKKALDHDPGDILVFLPGMGEIRKMQALLSGDLGSDTILVPLFGNLSLKEQTRAIEPALPGQRKIVLATSIAETSLTIEGIRVVVDSGLMRVSRFSPGTGMGRLETVPVSKASADQRRGRAGRTAPGTCYRIWSAHVHKGLVPFTRPEILCEDLASLVLDLALWGVRDPADLPWMDLPPESGVNQARDLLRQLGALDQEGRITDHGRKIVRAGIHPRLAHMILMGKNQGLGQLACRLAALLEARDILDFDGRGFDPDVRLRLEVLEKMAREPDRFQGPGVRAGAARNVLKTAAHLQKKMGLPPGKPKMNGAGSLLAHAFPERVAKKRDSLSYAMASGSGACFKSHNSLSSSEFIVAAQVDGNPRNASVFLGAPYSARDLEQDFKDRIRTRDRVDWDGVNLRVRAVSQVSYGELLLRESPMAHADPEAVKTALIQGIRLMGLDRLPWSKKSESLRQRAMFLKSVAGRQDLPDLSDGALESGLEKWLAPFLDGIRSARDLKQVDLFSALSGQMTWEQQQVIEKNAPTHILVPSGSRIPLKYSEGDRILESPVLAVRLQEMFGLVHTPAAGGFPVTVHLLSPAGRPVQITRDLENFWETTYKEVKKDLMGRYPKHYWPDDPLKAAPTHRAKPRKK